MKKIKKRSISFALVLVIILSLSSVAFAASSSGSTNYSGRTLTCTIDYYPKTEAGTDGELSVYAQWSSTAVNTIVATGEVVD